LRIPTSKDFVVLKKPSRREMKGRNFGVWIFIALVSVATIVAVPFVLKKINADVISPQKEGRQLLLNNDFSSEKFFDNAIWTRISDGSGNIPEVKSDFLELGIVLPKPRAYNQISQKTPLKAGKIYELNATYQVESTDSGFEASFGFLQNGPVGTAVAQRILEKKTELGSYQSYFAPKDNFPNAQFFLKVVKGQGTLKVKSVKVMELDQLPSGAKIETALPSSPTPATTISPSPTPSLTLTASPSKTPSLTPTPTPSTTPSLTPTPSPTLSATPSPTASESEKIEITLKPYWSAFGLSRPVSSHDFTAQNIYVFQMLAGKWIAARGKSEAQFVLNQRAGVYVYNPSDTEKNLSLIPLQKDPQNVAGTGWNLLYNDSDKGRNLKELSYQFSKNGSAQDAKEITLGKLIEGKLASSDIYVLKQTTRGVALNKIDISQTPEIPAKSAFWFYVFDLPK